MNIAYVRVSTIEQNEARQIKELEKHDIEKWYIDKASAKDTNRPKLEEMLEFVREGDKIFIHSIDRLARNTLDLLNIVESLGKKKVDLVSLKDNIDFNSNTGKFMLTILGAVAELERSILRERQKEGIAIAVEQGKFKGRRPMKLNEKKFNDLYQEMKKGYITKVEMAEELKISRSTLYRRLEEFEEAEANKSKAELEEYKSNVEKIKKGYVEENN